MSSSDCSGKLASRKYLSRTPTYISWRSMMYRCNKKTDISYKDYGGRGISVCPRWELFENFLADMGERPEKTTLDRISSNGDYDPSNCRWADKYQQARNKRTSVMITHNGVTRCASEWEEVFGLSAGIVSARSRRGITPEDGLFLKTNLLIRTYLDGKQVPVRVLAEKHGITTAQARHRLKKGLSLDAKFPRIPEPADELLRRDYWELNLSTSKIAEKYNVSQACVHKTMKRHGIKTRKLKDTQSLSGNSQWKSMDIDDPDVASAWYLDEKLSMRQMAERQGCSLRTVARVLKRHGIQSRKAKRPDQQKN